METPSSAGDPRKNHSDPEKNIPEHAAGLELFQPVRGELLLCGHFLSFPSLDTMRHA
jgi:hypothetical protein